MQRQIFTTLLLLLFVFGHQAANAQGWSYVYIQGDKQVPFYVKLEGEMLPRYSKNYCIIPQLEAGQVHIQILFQQNLYPAQKFTVIVPEDGHRGFILTRKDNAFALYDVQQHFYLMPGDAGEDHLPDIVKAPPKEVADVVSGEVEASTEPAFMPNLELSNEHTAQPVRNATPVVITQAPSPRQTTLPARQLEVRQQEESVNVASEQAVEEVREPEPQRQVEQEQPQPVVQQVAVAEEPVVNRQREQAATEEYAQPTEESTQIEDPGIDFGQKQAAILNSDCPEPLDETRFEIIYNGTVDKSTDDKRILYLMKRIPDNCFTTKQASILASRLTAESMRYSFLKKIYPRIVDQQYFSQLDQLFKTMEWKAYFRLIQ